MKIIKLPKYMVSTDILYILLKLNFIYGWSFTQPNEKKCMYYIYCNFKGVKKIHTFLRRSRQLSIKRKFLLRLSTQFNSHSIFLTTSKGIISIKEAASKSVGGFLFFAFY